MELVLLLEAFCNRFTEPSFRHFTRLVLSPCVLPIVTGSPISLARMEAESQQLLSGL